MQGRRGMNSESPMQSMHMLPSRVFNIRGYPHLLWYAPSTMVLVLLSSKYRAPRYFDVAHTEDHKVPYTLVVSLTEYHGKWTRATPWCPVEYHVWCGPRQLRSRLQAKPSSKRHTGSSTTLVLPETPL